MTGAAATPAPGPNIITASDGRAGNAAHVRAVCAALMAPERRDRLTAALGRDPQQIDMTLSPRAPWRWLPADRWPLAHLALPNAQRGAMTAPWPRVWIAAGRRSAAITRSIRRRSDGGVFTVQILDPRIDAANFDLLVTPAHDGVSGGNVISTIGSPSHFSADRIAAARHTFAHLASETRRSALVILGGNSRTHTFTDAAATRLFGQLRAASEAGWHLRITASRRTPPAIAARARALAEDTAGAYWASEADGQNPYLAWLIHSDVAVVTEDSANMLSDAAWHGLPVHIARLEGRADKFDRLHDSFIERGVARWFSGALEHWEAPTLREADRVAEEILARLTA